MPNYLEPVNDVISPLLLATVNASLPEGSPVPNHNPQYIAEGVETSIELIDVVDLWVTFVHEGAGYKNALGYYSYPTNNPPATKEDISNYQIVFPNVSYAGSGGGLQSGNKVYLGRFQPGTTVAWFIIPDGWRNGSQTVVPHDEYGKRVKFSDKELNTFASAANRSHIALLADEAQEILLMGMEDISRPGGDKDFNDAVFYVTANPFSAVNTDDLADTQISGPDEDNDGIPDEFDEDSTDPDVASSSFYPVEGQTYTLAFEDFWPDQGDYDMNDLVLDYTFTEFRNGANKVVKLRGTFTVRAIGAGFRNGFGFELPVSPSVIESVSGNGIFDNYLTFNSNGTESGQSNAVIIAFDNAYGVTNKPGGGFVNTEDGDSYTTPGTINVDIRFNTPQNSSALGTAPYNPFVIKNQQRGYEIHLPDQEPTDLANVSILGTGKDDSNPGIGRYYKTANNLPWALNITTSFQYPIEKLPINTAYTRFQQWAEGGGASFTDWHTNQSYRNTQRIFDSQ